MNTSEIIRLAGMVFAAVTFIIVGDTSGKLLTGKGVDPIIVAWSRFGIAAILILPFSGLSLREIPKLANWRIIVRAGFIVGGISCILTALKTEPIANVFGAFFIGPVVSYILAVLFLGEKPSRIRGVLLAVGFAGVMLVVKPGFGATTGMGFALIAGTCYGTYLAMTRTVAGDYRPRFLLISQLMIGALMLTPLGLSAEFSTLNLNIAVLILLSALGSALGNFLLVVASKTAQASLIAPLVYSQLIPATIFGVIVFDDWPDYLSFVGLILIVFSGLATLFVHQRATSA